MKKIIIAILCCSFILSACGEKQAATHHEVTVNSFDELHLLFKKYNYTDEQWNAGSREVPRFMLEMISDDWKVNSQQIPVQEKKSIFLKLMLPLILIANEQVLAERELVKTLPLTSSKLIDLAIKYRVIEKRTKTLNKQQLATLLMRVDIIPPSLALAQSVEESGWGTSRFAHEGNALFGQWDFSGNGIKPKAQRKELGNYGIARFDSPLASVQSYLLNLNSSSAYLGLRQLRNETRKNKKAVTGTLLAGKLTKYSERGQEYVTGLRSLIRHNQLDQVDDAYLANAPTIHILQ